MQVIINNTTWPTCCLNVHKPSTLGGAEAGGCSWVTRSVSGQLGLKRDKQILCVLSYASEIFHDSTTKNRPGIVLMWWKRQEKQSLKADTFRFAIRLSELSVQGLGYFIELCESRLAHL